MENIMDYWKNYYEVNEKMFVGMQELISPQENFITESFKDLYSKNQEMFKGYLQSSTGENPLINIDLDEMANIWNQSYQKATQAYLSMVGIVFNDELNPNASDTDLFESWKQFYYKNEKEFSDAVKKLIISETMVDVFDKLREKYMLQQGVNQKLLDSFYATTQAVSRKDIARIASLIIKMETKLDSMQEEIKEMKSKDCCCEK